MIDQQPKPEQSVPCKVAKIRCKNNTKIDIRRKSQSLLDKFDGNS